MTIHKMKWSICWITPILLVAQFLNYAKSEPGFKRETNRDDEKFNKGINSTKDFRRETELITNAHEVLRVALRQFLNMRDMNLAEYLKEVRSQNESFFVDELGETIKSYKKVFSFVLDQVEEVELGNYAVKQFAKDRHDLCSIARYLSHQVLYADRKTIIKRMGDALGQACDPCTPYKRLQHANEVAINTIDEKRHKCRHKINNSKNITSDSTANLSIVTTSPTSSEPISITTPEGTTSTSSTTTTTSMPTTPLPIVGSTTNSIPSNNSEQELISIDFKPCTHRIKSASSLEVNCEFISVFDVFTAFRRSETPVTSKFIDKFTYTVKTPLPSSPQQFVELPEDLINDYVIKSIRLYCPEQEDSDSRIPLRIDINAFRSTQNNTTEIVLRGCDLGDLDFTFLSGFDQLKTLSIDRATDLHKSFVTLPPLPSINRLSLRACTESDISENTWKEFPEPFVRGITELCLSFHNNLDDSMLSRILEWVLKSSADSLREFDIFQNKKMTTIPPQVGNFTKLVYFSASHNGLPLSLSEGSLKFGGPIENIHLTSSQITNILPGTFEGDFTHTEMIDLSNNQLTRFESAAFLPLLEQMNQKGGKLRLDRNPIDCESDPCHLAWIIRDRRELLENVLLNAKCSFNGTSFEDIDGKDDTYIHCPEE